MKRTPLYQTHIDAGAKFGEYAGFDMPLYYPLGVKKEHLHTRDQAGLFDISHMQHIEISGDDAGALISRLCPYEAEQQTVGEAKYTFMLNDDAGILDDLIVTRLSSSRYLIVANAGCAEKDLEHVNNVAQNFTSTVTAIPRVFLALQGPEAKNVLSELGFDIAAMSFMTAIEPKENWFLSRSGYTGEDGFEIALPENQAADFVPTLIDHSSVEWVGLAARDSLRLEAGLSLYGNDLSESTTPHEVGLMWAIPKALREGGSFIGSAALAEKIKLGKQRTRIGLLPDGRPVRGGAELVDQEGVRIGEITSGGFGPTLNAPMALGMVSINAADSPIFALVRGKQTPMMPSKLPFVPHSYKR